MSPLRVNRDFFESVALFTQKCNLDSIATYNPKILYTAQYKNGTVSIIKPIIVQNFSPANPSCGGKLT